MLPDIRFRVDDAHIGLIGSSIYQYSIVQLQKGIAGIVLFFSRAPSSYSIAYWRRLTGSSALCERNRVDLSFARKHKQLHVPGCPELESAKRFDSLPVGVKRHTMSETPAMKLS